MHEGERREPEGRGAAAQLEAAGPAGAPWQPPNKRGHKRRSEQKLAVPSRTLLVAVSRREAALQRAGDTLGSPLYIY